MLRSKSLPLQLKIDQRLAERHPRAFWKRWYQSGMIRVSTLRWCQWPAILLGMLYGWLNFYLARGLSDPAHWNLLNNPGIFPWLWPANLPPIRSVLFVGALLQLETTRWIVTAIPAWREFQETRRIDDDGDALPGGLYCRIPLSVPSVMAMFFNEMPWRFTMIMSKTTVISFYLFLFLAYDGRLALAPIVLGTVVGLIQAWVSFHVWVGLWAMQDYLQNSKSFFGHLYRWYLPGGITLVVIAIILSVLLLPGGWWAWLFPLPPLILDPQHPQATFGIFSSSVYYLILALIPSGWLHALLEPLFVGRLGLGCFGLIPLLGLAVAHWKYGHLLWTVRYLTDQDSDVKAHSVYAPLYKSVEVAPAEILGIGNLRPGTATQRLFPTAPLLDQRLSAESKLPAGGCGPFTSAVADLARRIFFPQANEQERLIGSSAKRRVPLSRYHWYIFPGLLVLQLIWSRILGRPADLLYVIGVIGVHGVFSMFPFLIGGAVDYKRALLKLPVHADWLIALWVQSCWRWCLRWLGILTVTWVPLLQWVDRIGLIGVSFRMLIVVLLMNCVVAGVLFLSSLNLWTELAKEQRIGFFDLRPTSLLREFYLTIGTLFWVATHIAVVLELAFAAPVWIIAIQLTISTICSWHLLYGMKQTNLYSNFQKHNPKEAI